MKQFKGKLIVFDGTEGCGKSTQIKLLAGALKKKKYDVLCTREPGGTFVGKRIRHLLLQGKRDMGLETETLLYMASRAELVREILIPALKQGKIVLCDRWVEATIAYQGYGLGADVKWIKSLAKEVTQGIRPHRLLFLDLPVAQGLKRARSRGKLDRVEKRSLDFHRRVYRGYKKLAKSLSYVKTIPVKNIQETHERILKEVLRVL